MAGKANRGKGRGGINPPNKKHLRVLLDKKKQNRLRNLKGCSAHGAQHESP
jgi:hypothetical protein